MREARGAVVALDPRSGEVLALATGPRFDPNWFSRRPPPPEVARALTDPYLPTWNRAVKIFEPGSTFKLVTSSALLESGFGNRTFACSSGFAWGGRTWRNWSRRAMGAMDARGAIANSCNTWYYQAAVEAGPQAFGETLARRAREFGFGEPTGIELVGEQTGVVPRVGGIPSPSAYREAGLRWENGYTLNYSIGQGDMRATPLQVARMLATIVNDGRRPELTVVRSVGGRARAPKPSRQLPGRSWSLLKEGMRQTVEAGTAKHVLGPDRFPVPTGGKTGTAQNAAGRARDHAWYMGYGPLENPNLVVVAFFENGVEGSGVALPAVKKVMAAHWGVPLDEKGNYVRPQPEARRAGR